MLKLQNQAKKGNGLGMSEFLKRKRMEMGFKLEDLSNGVCSVSYLSRIENNAVDVKENYYKALCEKMNIDYETVKEERTKNLYEDILRAYFKKETEEVENLVNHALSCNSYCGIEIELMVLFYNIINKNYDEARSTLLRLDTISSSFTNNELLFYMYAFALYAHQTNQNIRAYQQIIVLSKIEHNNIFLETAIYDLGIDIMISIRNIPLAYEYYYNFEKLAEMPLFGTNLYLHKLQLMVYTADLNYLDAKTQMEEMKKNLDLNNLQVKEKYYYYTGLIMYLNRDYEAVYNLLINNCLSARITSLLSEIINKTHNYNIQQAIIKKLDQYCFTKYEKMYDDYYRYIKLLLEGNSSYSLYNYVKNILLPIKNFYDGFLMHEIKKEYLDICEGCSKYKEGIRYIRKCLEEGFNQKLK
ncbi:MAG: helix-turn-helix transcriptional regulator [Mollicutes bacterium]|nr:helix-turn-helix transcriptional regulator [Mollicutes bacterium]